MSESSTNANLKELVGNVCNIAGQAARVILEVYESEFDVSEKADDSPLTQADLAAHGSICAGLQTLTPELPILSEESAAIPFATRRAWTRYWLVDPLDGTREFIKRNGEFTVNIALIDEHKPVLGVVTVPVSGVCYFACSGQGAWKRSKLGQTTRLAVRKADARRLAAAGSRSHGGERQQRFFTMLGERAETIAIGSSLKFCLVAEGLVDIYPRFGPTSEWDTAAAHCLVTEAGGAVQTLDFKPLVYNTKDSLLNPEFLVIGDPAFDWQAVLARASQENPSGH